jgi:hypothetical protein
VCRVLYIFLFGFSRSVSGIGHSVDAVPEDLIKLSKLHKNYFRTLDHAPAGKEFGECILEPEDSLPGNTVQAKFISGHLRYSAKHKL